MSHSTEYLSQSSFTQESGEADMKEYTAHRQKDKLMSKSSGHDTLEQTVLKEIVGALKHFDIQSISFFHHSACSVIERSLKKNHSFILSETAPRFDYFIKQIQFNLGEGILHSRLLTPEPFFIRLDQQPNNDSSSANTQEEGLFVFAKAFGPYGRSCIFALSLNPSQEDPSPTDLTPVQNIVQLFFPQLLRSLSKTERVISLTPREKEIVKWISRGKSNPEIAQIIGISVHTVNGYLRGIYLKTQTGDRVSLSFFALHHGLLS